MTTEMTTKQAEQTQLRPFHETIVGAIGRCSSTREALHLLQLIRETRIEYGYDTIERAIDEFFDFPGSDKYAREINETDNSLLAQKQATKSKGSKKKASITLDELEQKMIDLLGRLRLHLCPSARRDPSHDWNGFMFKELLPEMEKLHDFLSRALGK